METSVIVGSILLAISNARSEVAQLIQASNGMKPRQILRVSAERILEILDDDKDDADPRAGYAPHDLASLCAVALLGIGRDLAREHERRGTADAAARAVTSLIFPGDDDDE